MEAAPPPPAPKAGRGSFIATVIVALVAGVVIVALLVFPVYVNSQSGYTVTNSCASSNQSEAGCGYVLTFSSTWNSRVSVSLFASPESTPGYANCKGPGSESYNATWFTGGFAGFSFVSSGGSTHCTFSPGPTPENVYVTVSIISPIL